MTRPQVQVWKNYPEKSEKCLQKCIHRANPKNIGLFINPIISRESPDIKTPQNSSQQIPPITTKPKTRKKKTPTTPTNNKKAHTASYKL